MDILHLRYLLAVVDAGSLSRAATTLRVSQPALTQRMNQLERELGVRLVDRGPRGVRLTRAGQDFYRDAHRLVRQFDHLAATAGEPHQLRGLVAVGLPSGVAVHLAAPLYSWMRRHCPGIRLELFESMSGYIEELFGHGRMDLAVMYAEAPPTRSGDVALYSEQLHLFGDPPHPCPDPDRIDVHELTGVPIVAPGASSSLRALLERVLRAHDVAPTVLADVESLGTMLRIAESGDACAILPLSSTTGVTPGSRLAIRRIEPAVERHAFVRTAADTSAPPEAVAAVRAGIVAVTTELAATGVWPGIRPEGGDP